MKPASYNRAIITIGLLGVLISTYTLYVEMAVESHSEYKALCDISEYASCTRVLTSEYSKGFGVIQKGSSLEIPNCIYGIIFYCIMIFLSTFDHIFAVRLQLILGAASILSCFYLLYLLVFVLRDFCIVCVSTYFVNGFLLAFVYKKNNLLCEKIK